MQEIERTSQLAFYDRVEKTTNLADRAFMLSSGRFKPFDERTRGLVGSVADEGPVGALVQNLLHTPQPMPESILKPVRLPRPRKLAPMRSPVSLYDLLFRGDDEAA